MQNSNPNDTPSIEPGTIDDRREAIARGIDAAASTLHAKADSLPGGEKVTSAAHGTAEAMETAADYVREQSLRDMVLDLRQVVKRNPGAVLLAAVAVGFVLARALTRPHTLNPD
jgi:hypothetical protein